MTRQVEAHHFCGHQNEEFRQCLIYDRPDADGRLIGLEYIISEGIFLTLPDSEKPFWHSHEYEVKGGYLFMPGVGNQIGSCNSQFSANSSGDHLIGKTPTWPVESKSLQSAKIASDTKVQTHSAFKFDGAADAKIGVASQVSSSKSFISQTIPVNPQSVHQNFQGMNPAQAPLLKHTHSDIK